MAYAILEKLERAGYFAPAELEELRQLAEQFSDPKAFATELVQRGKLTRWQAGQLVLGRNIVLGKYLLIDVLSPDEINPLFLAQHRAMERRVVLRVLAKTLSQDEKWRNRFLGEAQLWAGLDSPRLVHTYNAEQDAGRYFLVLEFVDGENLEQLITGSGPLPPEALFQLAYEVAEGLHTLHQQGVVYGSLRPTKIMITPEGAVKLLDRGFSLWLLEAGGSSAAGAKASTIFPWQAPEVQVGRKLSPQSDLFSLGMCLLFAASGKLPPPAGADEDPQLWQQKWMAQVDNLPPELVDLMGRLLDLRPECRPDSAGAIVAELAPLVVVTSGEASAATEESPAPSAEHVEETVAGAKEEELPRVAKAAQTAEAVELSAAEPSSSVGEEEVAAEKATTGEISPERAAVATLAPVRTVSKAEKPGLWQQLNSKWQSLSARQRLILGGAAAAVAVALLAVGLAAWNLSARQRPAPTRPTAPMGRSGVARAEKVPEESIFPPIPADQQFDPTIFDQQPVGWKAEGADGPTPREGSSPPASAPSSVPAAEQDEGTSGLTTSGQGPAEGPGAPSPPQEMAVNEPEETAPAPEPAPPAENAAEPQPPASRPPTEASKPAPEKKEPVFEGFPQVVELPEFTPPKAGEELSPFEIGRVGGDPSTAWQLILLGGDRAFRKGWTFSLHEVVIPGSDLSWVVQVESSGGGKTQTLPVAKLWREGVRLYFRWDPQAPHPQANYLRNCLLQVRAGGASRIVRLREPVRLEMPVLDFDRQAFNVNVTAKWLPEEQFLLWELIGLDQVDAGVQSAQKLPAAPQGMYELAVVRKDRDGNTQRAVPMRLAFSPRSQGINIRLTVENAIFRTVPRSPQEIAMAKTNIDREKRTLERKLNPPQKEQAPSERERQQILSQLRELDSQMWYLEFFEKAHKKTRLRLRIFSEIAGEKLVLIEM